MQISFSLVTNLQTCGKWCDRAFAGIRRFSTFLDEKYFKTLYFGDFKGTLLTYFE